MAPLRGQSRHHHAIITASSTHLTPSRGHSSPPTFITPTSHHLSSPRSPSIISPSSRHPHSSLSQSSDHALHQLSSHSTLCHHVITPAGCLTSDRARKVIWRRSRPNLILLSRRLPRCTAARQQPWQGRLVWRLLVGSPHRSQLTNTTGRRRR